MEKNRLGLLPFGILILLSLTIIYYPLTLLDFANMDDKWMLLNDKLVHPEHFNLSYIFKLFTSYNSLQYSPGTVLYYSIIYLINGYDPYWYHLTGLLLHVINTVLIFLFIKNTLALFNFRDKIIISYFSCFIWAIHPFNVESVIWISASKVLLYTLFSLSALLLILIFFKTRSWLCYGSALSCFIASCMCKEQALILPITLFIFLPVLCYRRKIITAWRFIILLLPFFLISLIFGLVTINAQTTAIGINAASSHYSFPIRIIFSFYCLCFYIFNTIVPVDLHYQYNYPVGPGQNLPAIYYLFPIGFFLTIAFCVYYLKSDPAKYSYLFWFFFFLINILLCIQLVPMRRPAVMADRYMYLPLVGLVVPIVMAGKNLIKTYNRKKYPILKRFLIGFGVFYLIFLVVTSSLMAAEWYQYNITLK